VWLTNMWNKNASILLFSMLGFVTMYRSRGKRACHIIAIFCSYFHLLFPCLLRYAIEADLRDVLGVFTVI
jgi:hypothetical protein